MVDGRLQMFGNNDVVENQRNFSLQLKLFLILKRRVQN